jgi:glycosyltransferase involved in cell wall biosynthesis
MRVLCSISTKNRYDTFLPLAIQSVINQTRLPDKLVLFDDNDTPKDLRSDPKYKYLFDVMNKKGLEWQVIFGAKKGQHYNHQVANNMGYDWVWRVDDDNSPEENVLKNLLLHANDDVGAVGGSILVPTWDCEENNATGLIDKIDDEPNKQWGTISYTQVVDHLHCSFLYRAGISDYNIGLSKVAHREETLFTYQLKQKGYKILVVPNAVTWHAKSSGGGIRSDDNRELYDHDEFIFRNHLEHRDKTVVVLNSGMGDHIVFKRVLKDIKDPVVFSCYSDIIPGKSIAEANYLFGSLDQFNIYYKMDQWNWKGSLEDAFRKLYGVEK